MAQRRMFSLEVVDTDLFLDMPASSQALYFHLSMRSDDDGFCASPRKIAMLVNCSTDDLKLLIAKRFVIPFESGVCVIRDWRVNNYIQRDRYHETRYQSEKQRLFLTDSGSYELVDTGCIQDVSNLDTQVRLELGKSKERGNNGADKPPRMRFITPSVDDVRAYCLERKNEVDPQRFVDYYEANGWVQGKGKPIKDWKATVRTWERNGRSSQRPGEQAVQRGNYSTTSFNGEEVDTLD